MTVSNNQLQLQLDQIIFISNNQQPPRLKLLFLLLLLRLTLIMAWKSPSGRRDEKSQGSCFLTLSLSRHFTQYD